VDIEPTQGQSGRMQSGISGNSSSTPSHYENFPVASWLCPPALRAPIAAIYWFARTADDLADEGTDTAQTRLTQLAAFRQDLQQTLLGRTRSAQWPHVFGPLSKAVDSHQLPGEHLCALLDAFEQDIHHTHSASRYQNQIELLGYCAKSANPVGRLLLHLYGINDATSLAQSDAVCSALQLINFWQDLSQDLARERFYLPLDTCMRFGVSHGRMLALRSPSNPPSAQENALIQALVEEARALMRQGQAIVHAVPGRAGWELRAVIQGGLMICDRIEALGFNTWQHRPKLRKMDMLRIAWRCLWM
jgi:squalene synthase HpnC